MDVSHSVYDSVYDTRSGFSLNRKIYCKITSFCQVINIGFIRCEGKCFSQQHVGIVAENCILNKNYFIFILSYYTHDVVGGYAIKVLCCNGTLLCVLAGEKANFIIYFDYYVVVTDVIITRPDV